MNDWSSSESGHSDDNEKLEQCIDEILEFAKPYLGQFDLQPVA